MGSRIVKNYGEGVGKGNVVDYRSKEEEEVRKSKGRGYSPNIK